MFYAILGDTNGNDPQVTGEASWLLARSCFPEAELSGSKGHDDIDVTYILYTGPEAVLPPPALDEHYITDFGKLRSMGDHLTTSLLTNLDIPFPGSGAASEPDDDFDSAATASNGQAPELIALFVAVSFFVFFCDFF